MREFFNPSKKCTIHSTPEAGLQIFLTPSPLEKNPTTGSKMTSHQVRGAFCLCLERLFYSTFFNHAYFIFLFEAFEHLGYLQKLLNGNLDHTLAPSLLIGMVEIALRENVFAIFSCFWTRNEGLSKF